MPIGVERQWKPLGLGNRSQQAEVSEGIFFGAEEGIEHLTGGVIDGGDQGQPRPAVFEPIMITPVDLQKYARVAFPAAAVLRSASLPGA